ncbi:hypothetical protein SBADM41S_12331 [Streptomyces badius]
MEIFTSARSLSETPAGTSCPRRTPSLPRTSAPGKSMLWFGLNMITSCGFRTMLMCCVVRLNPLTNSSFGVPFSVDSFLGLVASFQSFSHASSLPVTLATARGSPTPTWEMSTGVPVASYATTTYCSSEPSAGGVNVSFPTSSPSASADASADGPPYPFASYSAKRAAPDTAQRTAQVPSPRSTAHAGTGCWFTSFVALMRTPVPCFSLTRPFSLTVAPPVRLRVDRTLQRALSGEAETVLPAQMSERAPVAYEGVHVVIRSFDDRQPRRPMNPGNPGVRGGANPIRSDGDC